MERTAGKTKARRRTRSLVAAVFLSALLPLVNCKNCSAVPEVDAVADYIYRYAYNRQIPEMTDEQWRKIQLIYQAYRQTKEHFEQGIKTLKSDLAFEFGHPLPQAEKVLAKQQEINSLETSIDIASVESAYQIRAILTPQQQQSIFLVDLGATFKGVKLTDEQKNKMAAVLRSYRVIKENFEKVLAQLQYERELLMSNPVIDEKALFAKQEEINNITSQQELEQLKLQIRLRNALSWDQLNKLYNSHRADMFNAIGVSAEQDRKLMEMHCRRADVTERARRRMIDLGCTLMSAYQTPETETETLFKLQAEIDKVAGEARLEETRVVSSVRQVLTNDQREKLTELLKLERSGRLSPLPYPHTECSVHSTKQL